MIPESDDYNSIYAVYELMEVDLDAIIKSDQVLKEAQIIYFMFQILVGVKHIHDCNIIHRDLVNFLIQKPKNILLNSNCNLKICDFGLSRPIFQDGGGKKSVLTDYIATRWYRPPEVLLEWDIYDKSLDIWSIGCIFAELLDRKPLFSGKNTAEQIDQIISILGTPKIEDIYKNESISKGREIIYKSGVVEKLPWEKIFPNASSTAVDLLDKMLQFEPDKRITIEEAIKHDYFKDLSLVEQEKPEPVSKFDFEFEDQDLDVSQLRKLILDEILLYHNVEIQENYEKAKKLYIKEEAKKKVEPSKKSSKTLKLGSSSNTVNLSKK